MAKNCGARYLSERSSLAACAIRRSGAPLGCSGWGSGEAPSHELMEPADGSAARRRCNRVVPVRCRPTITMGGSTGSCAIPGFFLISSRSRRRVLNIPTSRTCTIFRPRKLSFASLRNDAANTSSASSRYASATHSSPVARRAALRSHCVSSVGAAPMPVKGLPTRLSARIGHGRAALNPARITIPLSFLRSGGWRLRRAARAPSTCLGSSSCSAATGVWNPGAAGRPVRVARNPADSR
ncbi:Uncharacterised protein [Mycobacteroides abscessus subsp. abscessus]|nr:Uncharacterised protein [Mycobacteroides abscessus subsp. abscessus]